MEQDKYTNGPELEWRPVVGLEDKYEVSNYGDIRNIKKDTLLHPCLNYKGYPCVCLRIDGKSRMRPVHRLVAMAFIPNPENKPHIDHINGVKTDNRVENLHWVTPYENTHNPNTYLKNLINRKKHNKPRSEEAKARAKELAKARAADPEYQAKMAAKRTERLSTPEGRAKEAAARERGRLHRQKPVICIETGQPYASVKEAAEKTGVSSAAITLSCKKYDDLTQPVPKSDSPRYTGLHFRHIPKEPKQ